MNEVTNQEDELELSLKRNGKVFFRLDIGELDINSVLALTGNAITNARRTNQVLHSTQPAQIPQVIQQKTIEPIRVNKIRRQSKSRRKKPKLSIKLAEGKGISLRMRAVLYAVWKLGSASIPAKEILNLASQQPGFEMGDDPLQSVRFQLRQMVKQGLAEDAPSGRRLTDRGRTVAQAIAQDFDSTLLTADSALS